MFQDPPKNVVTTEFSIICAADFSPFYNEKNVESQRFLFWTENHNLSICLIFKSWIIPTLPNLSLHT